MSAPRVRPARAADLDALAALAATRSATAWSRAALADEIGREGALLLVAEREGRAAGYAAARFVDGECRLLDLVSAEDGRGAGRALWSALAAAARAAGASRLTFEVSARNARALAFYSRAGARVVGGRSKFYNDGSDAVLMDFQP